MKYLICETREIADAIHAEIEANWRAMNTESYCSQWHSYSAVQTWEGDARCTIGCESAKYLPSDIAEREGITVTDSFPLELIQGVE